MHSLNRFVSRDLIMPDTGGKKRGYHIIQITLFLAPILLMIFLLGREITFFFRADKPLVSRYAPPLSNNRTEMAKFGGIVEGEWLFKERSMSLSPGEKGRLILTLNKDKTSIPVFRLHTNRISGSKVSLLVALDGGSPKKVSLNGGILQIKGDHGKTKSKIELIVETPEGAAPSLLLRDLEFLQYSLDARRLSSVTGLLVVFLLFYIFILIFASRKFKIFATGNPPIFLLVIVFMALGFYFRWAHLIERVGHPLDPDAKGYLAISLQGKGLFQTVSDNPPYIREPLFIWFIRSAFLIFGDKTDAALRFLTVLLSVCVIPATYFAGRRLFGNFPAIPASLFCALNPYFIDMSARGLRMELYILCVLLFLVTLDRLGEKDPWKGVRCGLAGGICALTRLTSLSFTIPLTFYFAIRKKANPAAIVFSLVIPFIMIFPHIRFNYAAKGDPFFSSNIHARFYRNREFAGEPGFLTSVQVKADPYGGEPISTFEYIFGLHSFPQVISGTLKGLFRIFFGGYVRGGLLGGWKIFFLIYIFGFLKTLFSKKWEWVMAAVILEAPSAFLASLGLDWRLTLHAAPLLYFFMADGIFFILFKTGIMKKVKQAKGG